MLTGLATGFATRAARLRALGTAFSIGPVPLIRSVYGRSDFGVNQTYNALQLSQFRLNILK